jgi:AcrR family transcriptional regulator
MQRTEVRRRNRAALLDAAITEMARRGYQAARLEDIAASAGLTTGAIYSIFGSKRKLMDAAVQLVSADLEADLAPMRAPELSLDDTLRGYARTVFTIPAVIDRLTRILTDRDTPHLPSGRTTAADASRIATALAAVLRGLTQQAVLMPGSVDQDYAADAAAALAGLLVCSRADTKR